MDLRFSISENLASKLLNKKFKNMIKFVKFEKGKISVGIYVMLSVINIELKILKITPKEGITIEFVGNGAKSFMVNKVIDAFHKKANLTKLKDNIYSYSWKNSLTSLGEYKELFENAKDVEIECENGYLNFEVSLL